MTISTMPNAPFCKHCLHDQLARLSTTALAGLAPISGYRILGLDSRQTAPSFCHKIILSVLSLALLVFLAANLPRLFRALRLSPPEGLSGIAKGFNHSAQGCEARATLGTGNREPYQP
jgi:hypothetical protein